MKPLKKAFYFFITTASLLCLIILIGSIDDSSFDDYGLLNLIEEIPANKNGYDHIAYTQQEGFYIDESNNDSQQLLKLLQKENWNSIVAGKLLENSTHHIDSVIAATRQPYFKFPKGQEVYDLPMFSAVMDLSRLLVIQSIQSAKSGDMDYAIELVKHTSIFSQQVKTESNYWLISHMIGLAMQHEIVDWIHQLSTEYRLSTNQHKQLAAIFDYFPDYNNDDFYKIFAGEFKFSKDIVDSMLQAPLKERWSNYWSNRNYIHDGTADYIGYNNTILEKIFDLAQTLFPKYYIHANKLFTKSAATYSYLSQQSKNYCNKIKIENLDYDLATSWLDLITPNALEDQFAGDLSIYKEYFSRRCFGHAHTQSIKTIAAIMAYKNRNGSLPETLTSLIPDYLPSLPIDPFNGSPLHYSKSNQYVYSVGANFEDNKGATNAKYIRHCYQDKKCANNPSFQIKRD